MRTPVALVTFLSLCVLASPAISLTTREVDLVCPINGEKFKQVLAISGSQFGRMLDLKPFGQIATPWPLPVCPGNGFVVYRSDFRPEEIERFKSFVDSSEFIAIRNSETPYYRVAKLSRFLGEDKNLIAYAFLQATWEARSPDQYARYAREALGQYRYILAKPPQDKKKWPTQQLIAGELERRLGLFDNARARFSKLKELDQFKQGSFPGIIDLQLRLIEEKDTGPHRIPRKGR